MTTHEQIAAWKAASPNNTPGNRLIEGSVNGRRYFEWNLKPNDPTELCLWITPPTHEQGKR